MTLTLTGFMTARLDEAAALLPDVPTGMELHETRRCTIARCDPSCPTFIRDRIAADRAILDAHTSADGEFCDECWARDGRGSRVYPCPTLRWLARPYAGHPDYLPEWALHEDRP